MCSSSNLSANDSRVVSKVSSLSVLVVVVVCWMDGWMDGWGRLSLKGQQIIAGFSLLLVLSKNKKKTKKRKPFDIKTPAAATYCIYQVIMRISALESVRFFLSRARCIREGVGDIITVIIYIPNAMPCCPRRRRYFAYCIK